MVVKQDATCPDCQRVVNLTILGRFRKHGPADNSCAQSGELAPGRELPCKEPRTTNQKSSDAPASVSPVTPTSDLDSRTTQETPTSPTTSEQPSPPIITVGKGIDGYEPKEDLAKLQLTAYQEQYVTAIADTGSVICDDCGQARPALNLVHQCPADPPGYDQPDALRKVPVMTPDSQLALEMAAMLKEIFYQYNNRVGRSAQTHLGPSEIGSPCDRRLVMRMLGLPAVNPGGDKWAAFVGTCVHAGLAEMFDWADAGRGRFVTEMRVHFPNQVVPKGTLDVLDRTLFMVDDHKVLGRYSGDKLRASGPTHMYRVQLHVYAMGARMRGEKVERVALIVWPRERSSLDDLYVWTEPYDPEIARTALARINRLRTSVEQSQEAGVDPLEVAAATAFDDDCRYCEYHQEDAKNLKYGGCNGRS